MAVTDTPPARPQPARRPRLIATDLDGTLLRDDKTVSARTLEALAAASDAGIETVFVTGRPTRWMHVVGDVHDRTVAICANGAVVVDLADGRLMEVHPLAHGDALATAAALRAGIPGITFAVERTTGIHYEPDYPPFFPDPHADIAPVEKLLAPGPPHAGAPVIKLLARHTTMDPDELLARAREVAHGYGEFTRSSPSALLEVSRAGVSKATTLAAYCARRGLGPGDVVAFGDMPNDLAMLTWAGRSYAMANAHPDVLAVTTHRTGTNTEDGVATAIEAMLAESAAAPGRPESAAQGITSPARVRTPAAVN
ncbi:Cof-type HAD-IIB family hydrolase [Streptomyces sp. SM12]|uniref:Cof-type HAD-IIB family hydrolase n=1 Tax=unclassified Streptomyces TaxID=2593676 RepID=UPI000CD56D42